MSKRFWYIGVCIVFGFSLGWATACGPGAPPKQEGTTKTEGSTRQEQIENEPSPETPSQESSTRDAGTPKDERTTPPEKSSDQPPTVQKIETQLSDKTAKAGEVVDVTCSVTDQYGAPIQAQTRIKVTPNPRGFIKVADVNIHEVGVYKVACELLDGSLTDSTPEELTITPAEPNSVDTQLTPDTIRAGEPSQVGCIVKDRFGNIVPVPGSIVVTPKADTQLKGTRLTGTKAGTYNVTCEVSGLQDESPAELTITPSFPARIEVTPDPAKPFHKPEETILLERKVYDTFGNLIATAPVSVVASPDTQIDKSGYPDSIAFRKDGVYKVTVRADQPTEGGKKVEATLTLKVDGSGPQVVITTPKRADMLTGSSTVTIQGRVSDQVSDVTYLKVNGKTIHTDASGNFKTTMKASWGLNVIEVDTKDKAGNVGYRAQSFLWSPSYKAISSSHIPRAVDVRLNQPALDDGNRSTLNDLASILERVLNAIDIDKQVPTTIASGRKKIGFFKVSWKVTKTGTITTGQRSVTLRARTGGIALTSTIKSVYIPIRGSAGRYLNKSVKIVGDVSLNGNVDIRYSNGQVYVNVSSMSANVDRIKVNAFSGLFSFLNGLVTSALRGTIRRQLENAVRSALPAPIKSFIQGAKFDTSFTLPAGLGSKTLRLSSNIDHIQFDSEGGTLGMAASVSAPRGIASGKRGTPLQSYPAINWTGTGARFAFGGGLSYNIINQVLTAAWYSGALNQDVSSRITTTGSQSIQIDPKSLKLRLDAQLPPIIHSGTKGDYVDIALGDLLLDLEFKMKGGGTIKAKAYLTVRFGLKVTLSRTNDLITQLSGSPKVFAVDVVQISGLGSINMGDFGKLLQVLAPEISNFISSNVFKTIPIPSIDLSKIGGSYGIPAGTKLTITNGQLDTRNGFLKVTGNLK